MLRAIMISLVFAIVSSGPVSATGLDGPPSEPGYDRPSFGNPPGPPEPPEPPSRERDPKPKPPVHTIVEHAVVCEIVNHKLQVKFTANVEPRFYKEGIKFCKKFHPLQNAKTRCIMKNGEPSILVSANASHYAQKKANRFCMCVWGLD